ncbi:MAG: hypothetical protein HC859_13265, partial [Bacteroidia bacterium]|nr:hypothetical protein [Bacteroidia bacterium]
APTLDALTPADDATGVAQNANLVLDFDEQIDAGTGVVNLRRYSDDAVFDSFTMPSDPSVSIVGSIATLNPFGSLVSGIHYYVEVPAGAFTDEAGNPFAGFSTKDDWDFTVDTVPPNITGYDNNPACVGETLVISGTNFGLSTPTVTINGVNATVNSHTTTTINITVPNTTTGTVEVTNNDIGESDTSNSLVLTPGPNTGLNVVESATSVITGGSVSITVQSSESGVDYRLQRVSPGPITTLDGPDPGTGGNLVFSTGALSPAGTYQFRIRAQAGSCNSVNLTDMVTVNVFDFSADAGPDYDICQGDSVFLGGNPTVVGGSGFNEFTWTSNPAGTPLTSSNPKVKPSVTTSYFLRVEDSDGNIARDTAVVTVRPRTPASDLDILFDPDKVAFAQTDDPVNLSFTVTGGSTGTGIFSGPAVNPALDRFYPANAPVGDNTIQLDFTNQDNCVTTYTEIVQVYNPNDYLLVLQDYYCPEGTEDLDIVVPVGYTLQDISLYQVITFFGFKFIFPVADGTSWTKNVAARDVHMDLTALPQGDLFFRITYTYLVPVITYIEILPGISIPIITYVPTAVTVDAPFRINSPPTVTIQSRSSTDQFCANAPVVQLLGKEPGGIWQGTGVVPDFGNDGNPAFGPGENGQATFTPANANIGLNTLIYTFEDEFGCTASASIDFTVFAIPDPDFSDIDGCVGIPLDFAVTNNTNGTVSKGWRWTFDDGTSLEGLGDPISPTSHTYSTANDDYDVVLTVFTMDGCQNEVTKSISVGAIPDVAFEWENVCRDERAALNLNSTFVMNNPSRVDTIAGFSAMATVFTGTPATWEWRSTKRTLGVRRRLAPLVSPNMTTTRLVDSMRAWR